MGIQEQLHGLDRFANAWRWWRDELYCALPEVLKKHFSPESGLLRVIETGDEYAFEFHQAGRRSELGSIDLAHASQEDLRSFGFQLLSTLNHPPRVELIMDDASLLSREVFLPLAVEANLAGVLQFESDKLTPFAKGEALIAHGPIDRHPELNKLSVMLYCTDRKRLGGITGKLKVMGLAPAAALPSCLQGYRTTESANLLPAGERMKPEPLWNQAARRAGVLAAGLAALALIVPAWYLESRIESLQNEIDEVRVQATAVAEKRGQVMGHLMAKQTLVSRKNQEPGQLEIIAELTRIVPDNTWVSRLRIYGDKVLIQGESSKASDLIEVLEQSGLFSNVRFRSPITRNPRTTLEQYQIEMDTTREAV